MSHGVTGVLFLLLVVPAAAQTREQAVLAAREGRLEEGITALRATYGTQENTIDVVWSPRLTPSRIPLLNQRWANLPPGIPIYELAPDYPENRLNLIEASLKWGDRSGAWREYKALEGIWPDARKKLTGDDWAASWVDWEKRLSAIKKKIPDENITVEPPKTPRQGASAN